MIDVHHYLYPHWGKDNAEALPEWERRVIASWYATLKRGLEHGDSLAYW